MNAATQRQGRDLRNLSHLTESGSTSRVLNLANAHLRRHENAQTSQQPFFVSNELNKALVLKHTLRAHELDTFDNGKKTVTKVIIPFEPSDLKLGGSAFFIGQRHYKSLLANLIHAENIETHPDYILLGLIDSLPSLDPFFVREVLRRNGFKPASAYLKISPSDVKAMLEFVNNEIELLVRMALGANNNGASLKFATRILNNETDDLLQPLKITLRLSESQFAEGIFCWRGFLYFKWRCLDLQKKLADVLKGLSNYVPLGTPDEDAKEYLDRVRPFISRKIVEHLKTATRLIGRYDTAYSYLIEQASPTKFRDFLLDGPDLFCELGDAIGVLSHITSFWSYRMIDYKSGKFHKLEISDYVDLLVDFEENLSFVSERAQAA